MKRLFNALALNAAFAIAAPVWAQAPMPPSSPNDPASKTLGWVEAAPGSQTAASASPAPAPGAQKPTAESPAAAPGPEATTAGLPGANPAPSGVYQKPAAPRRAQQQKHARETRHERHDTARRPQPGDHMANQLNNQELRSLSAGGAAPAATRR